MASNLIARYVWLVDKLQQYGSLSRVEIDKLWAHSNLNDGYDSDKIPERTFRNYLAAIEEIFDIEIKCCRQGGYHYYIANPEILKKDKLRGWLLDTVSTLNQIQTTPELASRIQFEDNPSGRTYLSTIIEAMRGNHAIHMAYQRFGDAEPFETDIEPYAVKVFSRRWYVIARNVQYDSIRTYSLDRIRQLKILPSTFEVPKDFSLKTYFEGCCGIFADKDLPIERVVLKVYSYARAYVESLPLHPSQKEIARDSDSTTYELHVRPDFNFIQAILSQVDMIEVIEPSSLRKELFEYGESIMRLHDANQ